jgi:hypothetical protein
VAREVIEKLIDDLDGGDAAETVTFGLEGPVDVGAAETVAFGLVGTSYQMDLSKTNAAAFHKSLSRYASLARRSSARSRSTRCKAASSTNGSKPKHDLDILRLRDWAGVNKVAVPARGA